MRTRALLLCCLLAVIIAGFVTSPTAAKAKPDEPDFALWLVSVQYMHRADGTPDAARMTELDTQLKAAATPADKRRVQREIDEARREAENKRGYVVYGWSVIADQQGKPINQTRSMTGFMLPASAENDVAMKALARDNRAVIAVQRAGSSDLISLGGRRWFRAERAAIMKSSPDLGEPADFAAPPDKAASEQQKQSIDTSLTFHNAKPSDSGGEMHRFTIRIACDQAPANAGTLHAWVLLRMSVDGQPAGPILEHLSVPRGKSGAFTMSMSSDLVTRPGVKLDAPSATAELAAVRWE